MSPLAQLSSFLCSFLTRMSTILNSTHITDMQPSRKLVHPKENLVVVQISTYEFLHGHGFTNPSQTHGFEFDVCRNSYTIESLDSLVTCNLLFSKTLTCGKIKQTKERPRRFLILYYHPSLSILLHGVARSHQRVTLSER